MSVEKAREFIKKAKEDHSIQKKLHERSKHPVDVGREHGYEFTHEEFDKAMGERDMQPAAEETWCSNI